MLRKIFPFFVFLTLVALVNSAWGEGEWRECRVRHFAIYYKDAPEDFIQSVKDAAQRSHEEIVRELGFARFASPEDSDISVYIYADQQDYIDSSQQEGWSHGAAYVQQRLVRTFPAAHGFFDSVLPHELGHIVFRDFVGDNPTIPLWMDEGVAMYQERARRWGAHRVVKGALAAGSFIPLPQLSELRLTKETPRALVELFYAEAASVVYYMIADLGTQRFVRFCQQLREGTNFKEALHRVYGRFRNLDDLNRAWLNYLERQ